MKEGKELIRKFLIILQTYKSSGAVELATKFYAEYSQVDEFFLKVRELVIIKKKPRRIELNNNLVRYNEKQIEPATYPESFEGIIHSYSDRFPATTALLDQIVGEWDKTKSFLRV
jgi:dipeptidyl-peptidase III